MIPSFQKISKKIFGDANERELKASVRTHRGAALFPLGVLRYHRNVSISVARRREG